MQDNQVLMLLKRVKQTQDGIDFIEYLQSLSQQNYRAWKKDLPDANEFHKGYAFAIDSLIECFEQCDKEVIVQPIATAESLF